MSYGGAMRRFAVFVILACAASFCLTSALIALVIGAPTLAAWCASAAALIVGVFATLYWASEARAAAPKLASRAPARSLK